MQVNLDADLEAYIDSQIANGAFGDRDAVIREALRLKMRLENRHPQAPKRDSLDELLYLEAMARCDAARSVFTEECRAEVGG